MYTSARQGEGAMMLEDNSYRRIRDNLYDGLYLVSADRVIQYWNDAAEQISGFPASEVVGKSCSDNILTHVNEKGDSLCKGRCPVAMTVHDGKSREAEVFLHHKDGHRVPVSVRVTAITDETGRIIGAAELFSDISNARVSEMKLKELEEMALLDNLTKIANRNYIEKDIASSFEQRKRFGGAAFGILFMDIDHFKKFNDTYGHDVGDHVLKYVARTLSQNWRPFDVVGRWGGEEFIAIIRNMTRQQLEAMGNRLRILVESSYIQSGNEKLRVSMSIGATLVRDDDDREALLKRADTLLYESKKAGRNCLTIG